jgi:hypothetical protein
MNMFASLPVDISRRIFLTAVEERNIDRFNEMRATIANAFEYAATGYCGIVEMPLFEDDSSKTLLITKFTKNDILRARGILSLSMTFWVDTEEFELAKNTYAVDGDEEHDYSLFIVDKMHNKYVDIVSEVFRHIFTTAVVY